MNGGFKWCAGAAWVSPLRSRLSRLKKLSGKSLSAIGPRTMDARIVMAIPAPAHRVFDIVGPQKRRPVPAGVLGGFNRSSRHPVDGGVDDKNRQTKMRTFDPGQIKFTRKAASLAT